MTTLTLPRVRPFAARHFSPGWIPMTALALAFFVEMVDNTILNISLPTIGRDLGLAPPLQW
jgi:hypothetical protein